MSGRLVGKVGLVTGAGSGIGRECALKMAAEGARVVVSDVDDAGGAETIKTIESDEWLLEKVIGKAEAIYVHCDVSKPEEVKALVKAAVERFGALHLAVNNAGIGGAAAPVADFTDEDWRKLMSINLDGVFYCMKYEIPEMVKSGGGSIVNISSILGLGTWSMAPAYVSAKHGVLGLTKAAAIEYAQQGIRVNSVNPAFIDTPLLRKAGIEPGSEAWESIVPKHAMKRLGTPSEVANAVVWLLSDEASFVTGIPLPVDGGYTAQ